MDTSSSGSPSRPTRLASGRTSWSPPMPSARSREISITRSSIRSQVIGGGEARQADEPVPLERVMVYPEHTFRVWGLSRPLIDQRSANSYGRLRGGHGGGDDALRAQKAETRKRLLQAAVEVFGQGSVMATPVDAVAAAAGVSKATLFFHFGSRLDLLEEVAAHGLRPRPRLAAPAPRARGVPRHLLRLAARCPRPGSSGRSATCSPSRAAPPRPPPTATSRPTWPTGSSRTASSPTPPSGSPGSWPPPSCSSPAASPTARPTTASSSASGPTSATLIAPHREAA